MAAVEQPVQQRGGHDLVAEDAAPLLALPLKSVIEGGPKPLLVLPLDLVGVVVREEVVLEVDERGAHLVIARPQREGEGD